MANLGDYIKQKAREATRALMLMYQSTTSGQPPSVTMGHVNSESTQATLPDGTVVDVVTRGPYKEYTQVYNTNGEVYLVDNPEINNISADSQGQLGYVLSFNTATKILYVRKFASNNTIYSIDLSSYGLDFSFGSGSASDLISFSSDGRHICVATQRNIPTASQKPARIPGYIGDLTSSYYGTNMIFYANDPYPRTRFYPGSIEYNTYTPKLTYVILKNFTLSVVNNIPVVGAEQILSGNMDISTPYLASVPAPPVDPPNTIQITYDITMESSDTIEVLGIDGPPLYNNGGFPQRTRTIANTFFETNVDATNDLNESCRDGVYRIRGCWSFTNQGDEPLLEFYAFADSVKYSYNLVVPTRFDFSRETRWGFKIYPSATLDGCGAFAGYGTESQSGQSALEYGLPTNRNYWNDGNYRWMLPVKYANPQTFPYRFTGFLKVLSNLDTWSGVLTRPATEFCAPTYIIDSCFPYKGEFELAEIPSIAYPGTFEPCGINAWGLGLNFPFTSSLNYNTPYVTYIPPLQVEGQNTPVGPNSSIPFPIGGILGPQMATCGAGSEFPMFTRGDAFFNFPFECFLAVDNECPGNLCYELYPEFTQYPQSYIATITGGFWWTRCAVRDESTIKINHLGQYTRLSNSGSLETQRLRNGSSQSFLTSIPSLETDRDRVIATRHGVSGTAISSTVEVAKSLAIFSSDGVRVGSYYKVFKNANNQGFAALIGEGSQLDTLRIMSTDSFNQINTFPRENISPQTANAGFFPTVNSISSWIQDIESSTTSQYPVKNLNLSTGNSFRNLPLFTDKVFFNSAPSWLSGTFYRALDSYTFANLTTVSGRRVIERVLYDPLTDTGTVNKTVRDNNAVVMPGTVQDIWVSFPLPEDA